MTILIRGMEMPENCDDCFLGDFYCEKCQHIDGYKMAGSRPFNCPLIEVPTPHGRLIDADAIFEQWYQLNFDRKISDGTLAYWNVLLGKAPTVIEAEEGRQ